MAINYPTSLDSFSTKTDNVDDVQAVDINDVQSAIEELEEKVGVDSSADTDSIDYKINNTIVVITGNQTIAGVKTFTSSPVVPTPTTDMQSSTKKYVDDNKLFNAYAKYTHQATSGTSGGSVSATTWNVSLITNEINDTEGIGALSANAITLGAGTYFVKAIIKVYDCSKYKPRLYNVSDSSVEFYGLSGYVGGSIDGDAVLSGNITLASSKAIRFDVYTQTSKSTEGFGRATGDGSIEIYAIYEIWRYA